MKEATEKYNAMMKGQADAAASATKVEGKEPAAAPEEVRDRHFHVSWFGGCLGSICCSCRCRILAS